MLKIRRDHIKTEGQPRQIHKLPPSLDFSSDPPGIQASLCNKQTLGHLISGRGG